jgi:Uncharacterized iron-regulated membrane protein
MEIIILSFFLQVIPGSLIIFAGMRRIHKIPGLLLLFFIGWMSFSGIILNHRYFFSEYEINRKYLPEDFRYRNWNYGFFKGTVSFSPDSVFLYGNEGIWLSDSINSYIKEHNEGIRNGADRRKIVRAVMTASGTCYCAGLFDLYRYEKKEDRWKPLFLPSVADRISDLEVRGDTLVVLTRSELLVKCGEESFRRIQLAESPDLGEGRSLFRLIWKLHGGELFGLPGKLVVDGLAFVLVFLGITGLLIWLFPKLLRRKRRKSFNMVRTLRSSRKWHNRLGYWLLIPLLLLTVTGMFLRPPLLIAISKFKITLPGSPSENRWNDLLRAIRYDSEHAIWLLYTSEGFFSLTTLESVPSLLPHQPPVSVMGINVWHPLDKELWLVGSFNGLFVWNRFTGETEDAFTGRPYIPTQRGMPFGQHKVSGFSSSFNDKIILFLYDSGSFVFDSADRFIDMPIRYQNRSMSLWNLALEMHTGRLFTALGIFSLFYPFVIGLLFITVLISGRKIYRSKKKRRSYTEKL